MATYRVSDLVFASRVAFPELVPVAGAGPECTFALARRPLAPPRPRWYHRWPLPDGTDWVRFARSGSDYLLRFTRLADFLVSADAARVRCWPRAGTPVETVRHLFLNQVLPLVLGHRGRLVVHASAIVTPQGAVAFLGGSGRGKSTLAASFWAAGFPLVTDDCLRIDDRGGTLVAVPSYPAVRLWPDALRRLALDAPAPRRTAHYSEKLRVTPGQTARPFALGPAPLVRLYVLADARRARGSARAGLEPLTVRDALVELIGHLYRLDIGRRDALRRDFDRLADMAGRLHMCRLRVPRGLRRLDEVREAVLEDVARP